MLLIGMWSVKMNKEVSEEDKKVLLNWNLILLILYKEYNDRSNWIFEANKDATNTYY